MEIRRIANADEIVSVMELCANDFFDQRLNNQEDIARLAHKFAQAAVVLAVLEEDVVAGFLAGYCNAPDTGYISMLIIRKEFQRRGYAWKLLQKMVDICRENNQKRIRLEVAVSNETAIRFYKKAGFVYDTAASDTSAYLVKTIE